MAIIPTLTRQRGLPKSTGVGPQPQVLIQDKSGESMQQLGLDLGNVAGEFFAAQAKQHLNESTLGATIQLNQLQTDLAKEDPSVALAEYDAKADEIYSNVATGLSPVAKEAFDQTWSALSARTQVSVQANAIKRGKDIQVAGLDTYVANTEIMFGKDSNPLVQDVLYEKGVEAIRNAVKHNIITFEDGAKRLEKFTTNRSKNILAGFISRQPKEELADTYTLFDEGLPKTHPLYKYYNALTTPEQVKIRRDIATEYSRWSRAQSKKAAEDKATLERKQETNYVGHIVDIADPTKERKSLRFYEKEQKNQNITATQFDKIRTYIGNIDEAKTDSAVLSSLIQKIYDTGNIKNTTDRENQLKAIQNEMDSHVGNKKLTAANVTKILGLVEKAKADGFGADPITVQRKQLNISLGGKEGMIVTFEGNQPSLKRRMDALNFYDALVADGMDPLKAKDQAYNAAVAETPGVEGSLRPYGYTGPMNNKKVTPEVLSESKKQLNEAFNSKRMKSGQYNAQMKIITDLETILENALE
tara:strand:+ start:507 stop:2093 length:1587 start_codon:yes stop_codon:yes gene_type:complete